MNRKIITQIGSLPYDNIGEAVKYSLRHDISFLPELPKLGDSMLDYIKNPGKLSCLDEFKRAVQGYDTVKVQCVGPATLIQDKYDENEAVERAYNHIYAILDGLNAKEIILFLDEPALGQAGFDYAKLWNALFGSFKVISGVHTCGNMDWDRLLKADIGIISHNASEYDITTLSLEYEKGINGKRIAWGINGGGDVRDFQEGDLLTLPCGIGSKLYSPDDAEKSLEMLIRVSKELQK